MRNASHRHPLWTIGGCVVFVATPSLGFQCTNWIFFHHWYNFIHTSCHTTSQQMGGKNIQLHIMPTTTVFWQCTITVRHCKVVDTLKPLSQTHIYATMYTDRWWRRDGRVQVILARDTGGRWCGWMAVLYHVFITPATHTDITIWDNQTQLEMFHIH